MCFGGGVQRATISPDVATAVFFAPVLVTARSRGMRLVATSVDEATTLTTLQRRARSRRWRLKPVVGNRPGLSWGRLSRSPEATDRSRRLN